MAFKAVNNTAGLDGLVSTFLVFGAYLCIVTDLPSSFSQQQRVHALAKAISEFHKL